MSQPVYVIKVEDGAAKACPFCGAENTLWVRIDSKARSYIECAYCCARGPILVVPSKATSEKVVKLLTERWNVRNKPIWHVANRPRKKKGA